MPKRLRIALVPLDDRPVCLQYPQMLAGLAHAEVVAPPVALLGRFTTPGNADAIATWLRAQDWTTFDALIVSADMLAYGGLVASRVHRVDTATALARLRVLRDVHAARRDLPIYVSSVIMRLAPTADGANETWREALARYAELAPGTSTDAEARDLTAATARIPADALQDYRQARRRNRDINLAAVSMVADGTARFLLVSQDDAKPRGLHLQDRVAVTAAASAGDVIGRVAVQPGADEVGMLLLARAVLDARKWHPTVRSTFSSERARVMVAPYEDRPLHETVDFQIVAAGAGLARPGDRADLDLHVFASRHDAGAGASFAGVVTTALTGGAHVIVADVDPKGDVQGASVELTEALLAADAFPRMYGYASWNTAGNTVGTALAHGLLTWAGGRLMAQCTSPAWTTLADAQVTFMLHRLVNDYAYQGVVRLPLNRELRGAGRTPDWFRTHATELSARLHAALEPRLQQYASAYTTRAWSPVSPSPGDVAVQVSLPRSLAVSLPWDRTFEAAITLDVPVAGLSGPARRLPACTVASR
ncbi:MAG TPA: DUF4127 family protein, partial [Luteitalea sp.]|nr:DUF4127 family protein [Luteitalea sp.]